LSKREDRLVESEDLDVVYLVRIIDNSGGADYYGPYFDLKVAHRLVSAYKSRRSSSYAAVHILKTQTNWEEL
jgi:hypothetical protein